MREKSKSKQCQTCGLPIPDMCICEKKWAQHQAPKEFPVLLVAKEKHGTYYWNITDLRTLYTLALEILTKRYKSGEWYFEPEEPEKIGFTMEDIEKYPTGLQAQAKTTWAQYQMEYKQWNREHDFYLRIKEAVKNKLGPEAWGILRSRHDYEYERIEIEEYSEGY